MKMAGGRRAQIVVFATGPSSIRFGDANVILNPDWPRDRREWPQYEEYLKGWLGVDAVQVLHTRERTVANADSFVAPLRSATGVYLVAGNAGRYAEAYLGTRTQTELMALLARGGVIFGSSAGASTWTSRPFLFGLVFASRRAAADATAALDEHPVRWTVVL